MNKQTQFEVASGIAPDVAERAKALLSGFGMSAVGGPIALKQLAGGANNINLVVVQGSRRLVLKMRSMHGAKLTTGLQHAVRGQELAAQAGVAPKVLASTEEGDFLSEFLIGVTLRPDVFRTLDCLPGVVKALKTVHSLPASERTFDIFHDVRVFSTEAIALGGKLPDYFDHLQAVAERIQRALEHSGAPTSFLHGDLVPQNMILTEAGVMLVDFDYCGQGMIAADLAIAASQAELDHVETERFLQLYDPKLDDGQRARVLGIQFINTLREISWACAAERKVAETTMLFSDWSYEYHARINRELAERILKAHSVDDLEREIGQVRSQSLF